MISPFISSSLHLFISCLFSLSFYRSCHSLCCCGCNASLSPLPSSGPPFVVHKPHNSLCIWAARCLVVASDLYTQEREKERERGEGRRRDQTPDLKKIESEIMRSLVSKGEETEAISLSIMSEMMLLILQLKAFSTATTSFLEISSRTLLIWRL